MKLYNSLTKKIDKLTPVNDGLVKLYTCGPTVYDFAHIGNFRTYIMEDILRRALKADGYKVQHVMNFTDVDDKTIARSGQDYPGIEPRAALAQLTSKFEQAFLADAHTLGIDLTETQTVRATAEIPAMQQLIASIPNRYTSDDGVYFDIGKAAHYGTLVKLDHSHDHHRIDNDEYDKDHVADFALWKVKKPGEPSWPFELEGKQIDGRPGWHIECSAIATKYLGQPFDIHTGGIDLTFPHHENEIAQSRAACDKPLANMFVHGEHLLVDGTKMAKSKGNFSTLRDIEAKGYHPLAFRLLVLQSHYRSQLNFTWESLAAAQHFLLSLYQWAETSHQPSIPQLDDSVIELVQAATANDLGTPEAIAQLAKLQTGRPSPELLAKLDGLLGLALSSRLDISSDLKVQVEAREHARGVKDFAESDRLRAELEKQGILVEDTELGPRWRRAAI